MSIKSLKINPDVAQEGLWVGFPDNADKTIPAVKLARMSKANKRYWAAMSDAQKKYRRQLQTETLTPDQDAAISLEVFCNTIVLDWRHIQPEDDGVDIPFNKENVKALLENPEWEVFYSMLVEEAGKIGNVRDQQIETEAKNSRKS